MGPGAPDRDSSALAVNVLDVEYQRSAAQTNETGGQFLQTAADMAVQARNASSQAQALVVALMVLRGSDSGGGGEEGKGWASVDLCAPPDWPALGRTRGDCRPGSSHFFHKKA